MAKKNVIAQTAEETVVLADVAEIEAGAVEEVQAVEEVAEVPAGPTTIVVFTAARGKATRMAWGAVEVEPDAALVKIKGCAAEIPEAVAELVGADKFIAHVDLEVIRRCVEEGKAVRGTASTVTDVYNRYTKVTGVTGDRIEVALAVFGQVIEAIEAGVNAGEWIRPEEPKEEGEAPEAGAEEEEPAA